MTIGIVAWLAFVFVMLATLAYAIHHDDQWGG